MQKSSSLALFKCLFETVPATQRILMKKLLSIDFCDSSTEGLAQERWLCASNMPQLVSPQIYVDSGVRCRTLRFMCATTLPFIGWRRAGNQAGGGGRGVGNVYSIIPKWGYMGRYSIIIWRYNFHFLGTPPPLYVLPLLYISPYNISQHNVCPNYVFFTKSAEDAYLRSNSAH